MSSSVSLVQAEFFLDQQEKQNRMRCPAFLSIPSLFRSDIRFVRVHASYGAWTGMDRQAFGKPCGESRESVWGRLWLNRVRRRHPHRMFGVTVESWLPDGRAVASSSSAAAARVSSWFIIRPSAERLPLIWIRASPG